MGGTVRSAPRGLSAATAC